MTHQVKSKLSIIVGVFTLLVISILFTSQHGPWMNRGDSYLPNSRDASFTIDVPYQNLLPGEDRYARQKITVPVDTYINSFAPEMQGLFTMLHHANIVDTSESDIYCPNFPRMLFATGNEIKIVDEIYPGYGVPVRKGAVLEAFVHFANTTTRVESGILRLRFSGKAGLRPTLPLFLTIGDYCISSELAGEYTIPAGIATSKTRMQRPVVLPRAGKLLMWGGHVHQYGTSLRLIKNGEVISTLLPFENPHRTEAATSSVYLRRVDFAKPLVFQAGDTIDMEAVYQKPENLFYTGAMGVAGLFFDFEE
ncbi:MAG: hypothetical protein A3C84_00845 [Candidatus Ryanbacteria bacterium RIFCSPHIGHO2_02_FULL_48_12]|uniref:Copper type II ascorbate-dependent monooxygenase C-terminal domain-containing protein n=1 Tax=Candidatus Ryanbacteria bacterium RIFCSPHIGHO2_01_FULL_48_27 TaxID=1802115 RepID=A0A1G2G3Q7_9BACT|nr:MAG: hypothetical protein A2756_03425 [Candidatus Ryanbacteria bacterium RIFCSPHIGHO2_01_FULL_48_27]OGZ48323.1 MAG: hypothetical protein A3C84_00845 [Candidatus Ryanbacteria bacterium RIFCSPHIGHO2_02_FULL_48_12]